MGGKLSPPHRCWGNSSLLVVLGTQQVIAASDLRKETSISEEHGHLPLLPRAGQCRSRQVRTSGIPRGLKDGARLPLPLLLLVRPPALLRLSAGPPSSSFSLATYPGGWVTVVALSPDSQQGLLFARCQDCLYLHP